jgi:hypothetical protein
MPAQNKDSVLFQTETALMYDAALLFAHALSELDRSQVNTSVAKFSVLDWGIKPTLTLGLRFSLV